MSCCGHHTHHLAGYCCRVQQGECRWPRCRDEQPSGDAMVTVNSWQELIVHAFRPYSDLLDHLAGVSDKDQPPGTAS